MTLRINSGDKFHRIQVFYFTGPESAFGMNPGACILDAFGQIHILRQLLASDRLIVVFDPGDRS
ncbi:hypothetical protein [Microcoleus sp. AR_TQ3_B6]|uniref:hypothetical protein n=1 Tax=Microcoleus sp. AR_TQ3_B6 TaxID=3055284 RepID=UPI002FD08CDE